MRPSDITDGIAGTAVSAKRSGPCFNEAVGYYRRNPNDQEKVHRPAQGASMRPSDITDGTHGPVAGAGAHQQQHGASMRPSDITDRIRRHRRIAASCRPTRHRFNEAVGYYRWNPSVHHQPFDPMDACFNEAVGYYRRKSVGRSTAPRSDSSAYRCFNEAVGYYRRNQPATSHVPLWSDIPELTESFNEAVGYYRRNPRRPVRVGA